MACITNGQKYNFNDEFILITYNNLSTKICCENVIDVTPLYLYIVIHKPN